VTDPRIIGILREFGPLLAVEKLAAYVPPVVAARRVLIVEDDADLAENLREVFAESGLEAGVVSTAEDAIEEARRRDYESVVTDYRLPGKTGTALLVELRRSGIDVPVIVMSGYMDASTEASARRAGAREVLVKPVDPARLVALVTEATAG
jgi:DNA-binding NtrC family response regulator